MWESIAELYGTLVLQHTEHSRNLGSKETLVVGTYQTVAQALREGTVLRCCECRCGVGSDVGRFHMWDGDAIWTAADSLWASGVVEWVKCPVRYTPETLEEQWGHNHIWEVADPGDPMLPEIPAHGLPIPGSG